MSGFFDRYDVRPIGDFVVLKRLELDGRSEGGLYMPDTSKEKSLQAEVLAVGPGRIDQNGKVWETTVKEGDTVLVDKIGGFELEIDREKFLIVREPEIIAVIKRR